MVSPLISPNWHPLLIHYPIALLVTGVLIEILSSVRPAGGFRAAGRWMMLLGTLLAIPTVTAGIYAFRSVVQPGAMDIDNHWQQAIRQSLWQPAQWDFLRSHILYNAGAVGLFALAVIFWLAGSDRWRRSARGPLLILMLAGVGLMGAGAWYGGELVYRFATGVEATRTPPAAGPAGSLMESLLPPLQLHVVLAGFVGSCVIAGLALMIRRWQLDAAGSNPLPGGRVLVAPGMTSIGETLSPAERSQLRSGRADDVAPGPEDWRRVYPGWVWLVGVSLAIATAVAGAWSVMGVFTRQGLQQNLQELQDQDHRRLALHVVFGVSLILLSVILGGLVRFARRWRVLAGIICLGVVLLLAGQVWLGILVMYDGPAGPVVGFANAQVTAPVSPGEPARELDAGDRTPAVGHVPPPVSQPAATAPAVVPSPAEPPPADNGAPAGGRTPHEEIGA
jgi:uncharacterized membrane protein